AIDADGALAGYLLARLLHGEFGRRRPALRIELVGARREARGQGLGRQLFEVLRAWAVRHEVDEIHTVASWTDVDMLRWLQRRGFALAPHHVIESAVDG